MISRFRELLTTSVIVSNLFLGDENSAFFSVIWRSTKVRLRPFAFLFFVSSIVSEPCPGVGIRFFSDGCLFFVIICSNDQENVSVSRSNITEYCTYKGVVLNANNIVRFHITRTNAPWNYNMLRSSPIKQVTSKIFGVIKKWFSMKQSNLQRVFLRSRKQCFIKTSFKAVPKYWTIQLLLLA